MAVKRIAVGSKDGESINVHLGVVKRFFVYDADGEHIAFVGERSVPIDDPEASRTPMPAILDTVDDCQVVLVGKIGGHRRQQFDERGIEVITAFVGHDIEDSLSRYQRGDGPPDDDL